MKKLTITFIILDILVAICFFVVYSPVFENLQNTIISTATVTKTHGYIAHVFYSDSSCSSLGDFDRDQVFAGSLGAWVV